MAATCRQIRERLDALGGSGALPSEVRDHLAACRRCARDAAAARLAAGLLRAGITQPDPPDGFAARVAARAASAARQRAAEAEVWRPAWGLVPAFVAVLGVLLLLQQGAGAPEPISLWPTEGAMPLERLILTRGEVSPETVLELMLGDGEP